METCILKWNVIDHYIGAGLARRLNCEIGLCLQNLPASFSGTFLLLVSSGNLCPPATLSYMGPSLPFVGHPVLPSHASFKGTPSLPPANQPYLAFRPILKDKSEKCLCKWQVMA